MQRHRVGQLLAEELHLDVVQHGSGLGSFMQWLRPTEQMRWPHLLVLGIPAHGEVAPYSKVVAALRQAGIRVLAMTSSPSRPIARQLLADGIDGMVSTTDGEREFLRAADAVLSGRSVATPGALADVQRIAEGPRLSIQEERVLALYASGLTIVEVANSIGVRHDTARKYLNRVRDKFTAAGWPARSKLELARIAWAEGYADPDARGRDPVAVPSATAVAP